MGDTWPEYFPSQAPISLGDAWDQSRHLPETDDGIFAGSVKHSMATRIRRPIRDTMKVTVHLNTRPKLSGYIFSARPFDYFSDREILTFLDFPYEAELLLSRPRRRL
jgi:hypothetical protein